MNHPRSLPARILRSFVISPSIRSRTRRSDGSHQNIYQRKLRDTHEDRIEHSGWPYWLKFFKKEGRRCLGEIYGTFMLTFISAMGLMAEERSFGRVTPAAGVLAAGFVLAALIYSESQVSGAHFNPTVTLAFALRGVFSWWRVPIYWACEFGGALIAGAILRWIFGHVAFIGATLPTNVTNIEAFGLEIVFTLLLVYTIVNTTERIQVVGPQVALAVGLVLACIGLVGGPLTGASMNPARSLGSAVWGGERALDVYWIYLAGPVIGSLIAVALTWLLSPRPNRGFYRAAKGIANSTEESSISHRPWGGEQQRRYTQRRIHLSKKNKIFVDFDLAYGDTGEGVEDRREEGIIRSNKSNNNTSTTTSTDPGTSSNHVVNMTSA